MKLHSILGLTLATALGSSVLVSSVCAQIVTDSNVSLATLLQQNESATLPEIEVRPPAAEPPIAPIDTPPDTVVTPAPMLAPNSTPIEPAFAPPEFPTNGSSVASPSPANVASRAPASPSNGATANSPFSDSFPSLSEQIFGSIASNPTGLNSAFRGESDLFDSPQLGTIVDRSDLDRRQATTMFRALQNEVGVTLQQTGNGQLSPFIRGLTGQQILVLVDGIRMNTSILRPGPNQYAATIDPGTIQRIEVIRGAESALWGSDAIGGVINVVTRSADPLRGNYSSPEFSQIYSSAEASSYTRTGFSGWYGATGIVGGISYLDVGNVDRGGDLGRQFATDYQQYAGDVKLQRMLTKDHLLTVALQHFEQQDLKRSDRFLPFVLGPAPDGSVPTQRPTIYDPQQRDLIYARLEGLLPDDVFFADAYSVTFSGTRTKEGSIVDRYTDNSAAATITRREISEFDDLGWGTVLSAVKNMGDFGRLTYGTDFYAESINAERIRINDPANPVSTPANVDPQYPDDSAADRVGAYLSWNVPVTDRLDATTSVRYENINVSGTPNFTGLGETYFQRSYQDWIASIGLSYELTENMRLIGGVYEGFRAPTIDDLTANKTSLQNNVSVPLVGNLAAEPEHSYTYEVGLKFNYDRLRLQAVEYWTDFDSFLSRETIGGVDFLTNQTAYLNGTEINGEYLLTTNLSLYGNFAYTYGQITSSDEPITRIPPIQSILGLRLTEPNANAFVDVYTWMVGRSDRYNQLNLSDVRFIPGGTPGYATLNVRTGRSFGDKRQHQLSLSLENLTDKGYRVLGSGVDGTGFNAIFGYQWRL
ncbi:TonB-dependent receptor [Rubripirellula reticaptiva]|uniref:Vitamin B12 transporter BtuB n=1 Tax=Rubripirellula reticaptiva TaxID=2528013 RepID=A0A5C6F6N0_9BACT|nr:TonB-dependent receptor [Rubripirellula reticaptiva]TWU56230.1 Vitamin B12 transporter BtuB precursor [Rubripirellula reticaptiva]